jgi:hypothetical protein
MTIRGCEKEIEKRKEEVPICEKNGVRKGPVGKATGKSG